MKTGTAQGKNKPKKEKTIKDWPSNSVELSGYAGSDPVFQKKDDNRIMARFTLGTHQLFRDNRGRWVRTTVWHTVVTWDRCARKTVEMVRRGSHVSLKGRLRSHKITSPDGENEIRVFITAFELTVNIAA